MEAEQPGTDEEPCEQCGLCCRIFGPGIAPTPANLYAWMEEGRVDVLAWFVAFRENGEPVPCTKLLPEDLGDVIFTEMRDPATGDYVTVCPFLRRIEKTRYICGIHRVKPDMCRNYQPWVWGETAFNRCPALRTLRYPSRWPI